MSTMAGRRRNCGVFGTGRCCNDKCFDLRAVPEAARSALEGNVQPDSTSLCDEPRTDRRLTSDRSEVTCSHCKEVLGA